MAVPPTDQFWRLPLKTLCNQVEGSAAGLTSIEARKRSARFGPNAAYTFDVKGNVTAEGVRGEVTPVGVEKAPFSRSFEGKTARNLLQR